MVVKHVNPRIPHSPTLYIFFAHQSTTFHKSYDVLHSFGLGNHYLKEILNEVRYEMSARIKCNDEIIMIVK